MDNLKKSVRTVSKKIRRTNKALSDAHIEILAIVQSLRRRLTKQKEEWIAQGKHPQELDDECVELLRSGRALIEKHKGVQESFNAKKSEIERQISAIPRGQLELKFEGVSRLRDLMANYLNAGILHEKEIVSELESEQEKLEAFVASLRGSP